MLVNWPSSNSNVKMKRCECKRFVKLKERAVPGLPKNRRQKPNFFYISNAFKASISNSFKEKRHTEKKLFISNSWKKRNDCGSWFSKGKKPETESNSNESVMMRRNDFDVWHYDVNIFATKKDANTFFHRNPTFALQKLRNKTSHATAISVDNLMTTIYQLIQADPQQNPSYFPT